MQIWLASAFANHFWVHPQARDFARLPNCIIRYNLFGVVNRRLIGDNRMKLATL
jgi:hypothetical protein